jgi:vacuolar protein sorting-associated protein 16
VKRYKVPERRYWHIQVKAFADSGQWTLLRTLAQSLRGKSPIGFKPFASAAIRGKQSEAEVMSYIDRVFIPEERYDLLCEAGLWKKALEEANKMKDSRRVLNVKSLCSSSEIQLQADEVLGRLA